MWRGKCEYALGRKSLNLLVSGVGRWAQIIAVVGKQRAGGEHDFHENSQASDGEDAAAVQLCWVIRVDSVIPGDL